MQRQRVNALASDTESIEKAIDPEEGAEPALEEWEHEGDWQGIERMLDELEAHVPKRMAGAPSLVRPAGIASPVAQPPVQRMGQHKPRSSWPAWCALSLGLTALACGAVLLGWSFWTGRADLTTFGLPLTLAGQVVLTIGVLLQLEHLAHGYRSTLAALAQVDSGCQELRRATALIAASHSAPAQSFYAHLAQGAAPDLLLADLKAQLDLLSMRFAEQQRA
jgi:hypothetical protein